MLSFSSIEYSVNPEIVSQGQDAVEVVHKWMTDFVMQPHPDLGREGHVCPFVKISHDQGRLRYFVGDTDHLIADNVDGIQIQGIRDQVMVRAYEGLEIFNSASLPEDPKNILDALVMIFPYVPQKYASEIIDVVQQDVKQNIIQDGLMIGEFHMDVNKPGIRVQDPENTDFYPLRSPVPLLVIRRMHPSDILFLTDTPHCFESYLRIYGARMGENNPRWAEVLEAAKKGPEYTYLLERYTGIKV